MKKIFSFIVLFSIVFFAYNQSVKTLISNCGSTSKYPDSDIVIVFDSTIVDVQESGLSYVNGHKLYKVLTENGAKQLSVVKYDYDPLSAFVEIREVKIYRKNGEIENIDVSGFYDYPAPARMIYWGARQVMVELGKLFPGDAVEVKMFRKGFTYALLQNEQDDDNYIPPMRGHFYDIVEFWSHNPVCEKVYRTKIPESKEVQYKFYNGEVNVDEKNINGKNVYTFTKRNYKEPEREYRMVAMSDIAPKLLISTSPDWEAKSKWFYGVNEEYGSFDPTPEVKEKVDEILIGAKDEMDSVSRLTHWVADNMRYSGISMGKGEGYTLHNAEMNFTDRCGVCKDKASLLIAFLRAAGFESYAAMTMAGSRIDRIPADQFNHSVTVVKLSDGKYHLLDPTWVPFVRELWSSREQQQNYLMGLPDGADLMETAISPPENHYFRISGESSLAENGTLTGKFVLDAEGQSDAMIRSRMVRSYQSEWRKTLELEMKKVSPFFEITKIFYPDFYDYSKPMKIEIEYKIPQYALVTDEEIIFTPLVASNLFKSYNYHLSMETEPEERKYNFRDACSKLVELNEIITLPAYSEVISFPEKIENSGSGADINASYTFNSDKLVLSETVSLKKRIYTPDDWDSYKIAVDGQNKFANTKIILKK